MGMLITSILAIGLIVLLVRVMGSKSRYGSMTEEEFEQESRKKTLVGSALVGFEMAWRRREAEQVMEARTRVERDATPAPGDPPSSENPEEQEKS